MKSFRIVVIALTLMMLVSAFAGCSSATTETESVSETVAADTTEDVAAADEIKIGFIMKVVNPYFEVMQEGAEAKAEELGVTLLCEAALEHTDIEGQIAIIEDMISQGVDAICIAPSGSKEVVPALELAIKAGIPVVDVDNRLDAETVAAAGLDPIPYVGVEDINSAYMAASYLVEQIGGEGKVAILEGIRGVDNAENRRAGAEKAFNEASGIEIVASQTANWGAEEALNVFTNILQANPDLNGVFCANDQMAFGAIQAIEAIGKTGEILVVGIDAEEQAYAYIREGKMLATIHQNQDAQGATAVETAFKMINGEDVDTEIIVLTLLKTIDEIGE